MNIRTIEVNIYFVFLKSLILVRYSGSPVGTIAL